MLKEETGTSVMEANTERKSAAAMWWSVNSARQKNLRDNDGKLDEAAYCQMLAQHGQEFFAPEKGKPAYLLAKKYGGFPGNSDQLSGAVFVAKRNVAEKSEEQDEKLTPFLTSIGAMFVIMGAEMTALMKSNAGAAIDAFAKAHPMIGVPGTVAGVALTMCATAMALPLLNGIEYFKKSHAREQAQNKLDILQAEKEELPLVEHAIEALVAGDAEALMGFRPQAEHVLKQTTRPQEARERACEKFSLWHVARMAEEEPPFSMGALAFV